MAGLKEADERGGVASIWPRPGTDRMLLIALVGALIWIAGDVLLVIFAGFLLGVGLDGLGTGIARRTPLPRAFAIAIAAVATIGGLAALGTFIVPRIVGQIGQIWDLAVGVLEAVHDAFIRWGMPEGTVEVDEMGQEQIMDFAGAVAGRLAGMTMAAIGVAGALFVVIAIGLFTSIKPGPYRRGFLSLLPSRRSDWDSALSGVAHALRWWFLGQIVSMSVLGVVVSLGLKLIGVDLWLSLGVLTGVLTFIPILGPLIAGAPIVLVGFTESMQTGVVVLVFYLIVQNVEGNFLTPFVQNRAVHLPPALLISMQLLLGALLGLLGFILAAPLTVVGMVLVRRLYLSGEADGATSDTP